MGANNYFNKHTGEGRQQGQGRHWRADGQSARAALWQALREMAPIRVNRLYAAARVTDKPGILYLDLLERAGYVWRSPGKPRTCYLVNNTGPLAPVVCNRNGRYQLRDENTGQTVDVPDTIDYWPGEPDGPHSPRHKTWLAMRMLRTFTVGELVMTTELDAPVVEAQVAELHAFHYLREAPASDGQASFMLPFHRNTGPRAPVVSHTLHLLYDHNSKEVVTRDFSATEQAGATGVLNHG
ncbi:hypothetical protein [Candidatus Sororendozoicomonas aggregata]|uniref:hypothetical protein n=1 Tax=Candidatus Sororendozoicomonas aggregata TaxID=3073239 RepID=UPI002ED054B1